MTRGLILYNCHHDGDQYRVSKFVDGNLESSYLTTRAECQCPRSEHPTCRHRQMLPEFFNRKLIDTPWFLNWDHPTRPTTDFMGMIQPAPAVFSAPAGPKEIIPATDPNLYQDEGCPNAGTPHVYITPAKPWRRL